MHHAPKEPFTHAWDYAGVRDAASDSLRAHAARADAEQSVLGVDALPELALHRLLHEGFARAGFGVHAEVRYPRSAGRRKRSEGERCDVVLTRGPGEFIMDTGQVGTLFEGVGTHPAQSYWLEVKVVHQHGLISGVAAPNQSYSSRLGGPVVEDVRRLATDEALRHAGVLLILFTSDAATGAHDAGEWAHRCLDHALPAGMPLVDQFPITNRLGNGACTVALLPVMR